MVNILNSLYGAGTYARSTVVGTSTDGTTQAVIYNTHSVQLIGQTGIGFSSTSGPARQAMRFEFQPVGYDGNSDFYIYSSHYKAGTASSDQTRRNAEAQQIRADVNTLPANSRVLYTGDYNIQSSTETMYGTLTAAGNGQAIDPLNNSGTWHNNASKTGVMTQAPLVNTPAGSNLTGGGMDDRFDFQQLTSPVMSGNGMSYIGPSVPNTSIVPGQNSYHALGVNGSLGVSANINDPTNTALPLSEYSPSGAQPTRTDVLNALTTASDHLPVIADYQLPAKMSAGVAAVPSQVIVGTPLAANVSVSNVAPVSYAIGADELSYNVTGTGAASGAASGANLQVFAVPNTHALTLDTSTVGGKSGNVNVTGTSDSVANGTFNQGVNYTVLDHAAPDFVAATSTHILDIDFGTLLLNSGTAQSSFQITNLAGVFRAGLDLTGFSEVGDAANRFSTDLSLFSNLAAGLNTGAYQVSFDTDQLGLFTATYFLNPVDYSGIFGATGTSQLEIDVRGLVQVPEPSSIALAVVALAGCAAGRLYRKRQRID